MSSRLLSLCLTSLTLIGLAASATPKINWGPCRAGEFNTTLKLQCGKLAVPLDYTGTAEFAKNKTVDLQLVKVLAPTQPSRGGIQLNFGGPGAPTRKFTVSSGALLQAYAPLPPLPFFLLVYLERKPRVRISSVVNLCHSNGPLVIIDLAVANTT